MSEAERTQDHFKRSGGTQKRASEGSRHQRLHALLAVAHVATQVEAEITSSQISGQGTTAAVEPPPVRRVLQQGRIVQTGASAPHGILELPVAAYSPCSTSLGLADSRLSNLALRSQHPPRSSTANTPECGNGLSYLSTRRLIIEPRPGASQQSSGEVRVVLSRSIAEPQSSRGTGLQDTERSVPQISKTVGSGSSSRVDAGSSRGTRAPSSERAQSQAIVTTHIDHSGILEPAHEGNRYEETLGQALVLAAENFCRATQNRNQQMVNVWSERVQMLTLRWNKRSARSLPEREDQMVRRTGLPPVRHPEIETLLQMLTDPEELQSFCQLRLQDLVASSTDYSPERDELITQYTRLLLNPNQAGAEGGTAAGHGATEVGSQGRRAAGNNGRGFKKQEFRAALQSMTRPEQLIAIGGDTNGLGKDDRTRSEVLDYFEQNKTAAEIKKLTGVAETTIYKWKRKIREADKERRAREAAS